MSSLFFGFSNPSICPGQMPTTHHLPSLLPFLVRLTFTKIIDTPFDACSTGYSQSSFVSPLLSLYLLLFSFFNIIAFHFSETLYLRPVVCISTFAKPGLFKLLLRQGSINIILNSTRFFFWLFFPFYKSAYERGYLTLLSVTPYVYTMIKTQDPNPNPNPNPSPKTQTGPGIVKPPKAIYTEAIAPTPRNPKDPAERKRTKKT